MSGHTAMLTQKPAKVLYDNHIDFDILSADTLADFEAAQINNGKLAVNGETFDCLVVPYAPLLPESCVNALNRFQKDGLPVFYVDGSPAGITAPHTVELGALADTLKYAGMTDVLVDQDFPMLRVYHAVRGGTHYFMLFNESITESAETGVSFPCSGRYLKLNLLNDEKWSNETQDGHVAVSLAPYESVIYVFGSGLPEIEAEPAAFKRVQILDLTYDIERCKGQEYPDFKPYRSAAKPFNLTGTDGDPSFSGIARYTARFNLGGDMPAAIDLGTAGQTASVKLNGQPLGLRICPPYVFGMQNFARKGENILEIETSNTLVHEVRDGFSRYLQIPPSGITEPVKLLYR
jgi:hypothetical protein